jgi:predicted DNA-binding transcriptional regulator YafY
VYRVSRIEAAELTDETFERQPGFDLGTAWAGQVGRFREGRSERVSVTMRVDPEVSDHFARVFGDQIVGRPESGVAVVDFLSRDAAVRSVTAFGAAVEVLAPRGVRESLAELGRRLSAMYGA